MGRKTNFFTVSRKITEANKKGTFTCIAYGNVPLRTLFCAYEETEKREMTTRRDGQVCHIHRDSTEKKKNDYPKPEII